MNSSAYTCQPFVLLRGRDDHLYEFLPFVTSIEENVNILKDKIDSDVLVAVLWSVFLCVLRPFDLRTVFTGQSAHAMYSTQ